MADRKYLEDKVGRISMSILEILKVIIIGIVEGITEWLPISSTGHIILVEQLFMLNAGEEFKAMF